MTNQQTIGASEARNNFSDLVSKVQYQGQVFLIERYGEIVAKIVPVEKIAQVEQDQSRVEDDSLRQSTTKLKQVREGQVDIKQKLDTQLDYLNRLSSLHNPHRQVYAQATQSEDTIENQPNSSKDNFAQSVQSAQEEQKTAGSNEPEQKSDSGWSALQKLEELIATQRAKSSKTQSTINVQTGEERRDYLENEQPVAQQSSQNYQSQQIIRKKIEL